MADKRNQQDAPDAEIGATNATAAAPDDLNPMEMDGRGQTLSPIEQAQAAMIVIREQAKLDAAEAVRKANADALEAQRTVVVAEQDRRRAEAVKAAEESRASIFESRGRLQSIAVDPTSLALEAAHSSAMAAALQIDETVPGGYYIVAGRVQDANGEDLGPAPRD